MGSPPPPPPPTTHTLGDAISTQDGERRIAKGTSYEAENLEIQQNIEKNQKINIIKINQV